MGLSISQTYAQIGVERSPAQLEIRSQTARLELHQKHAMVNLHTELPKVEIDQYECFASAGLKNNLDLTAEAAQRGYQQAMEFIGKTAGDGHTLAAIERGGNPIVDIAVRDSNPQHEFGLDFIPKARPKITVKGELNIEFDKNSEGIHNGVEGNYTPGSVDINYTPSKVNIYMKQYNSVNISYQGNNIDSYI